MSNKVNTSEAILDINKTNDAKPNLGNTNKGVVQQTINGTDLLNKNYSAPHPLSENFEKLGPDDYTDEFKEYEETPDTYKDSLLQKYDDKHHIVNQPVQARPTKYIAEVNEVKPPASPKYELMYKDKTCAFFLGSISLLSLYVVYKFIERE